MTNELSMRRNCHYDTARFSFNVKFCFFSSLLLYAGYMYFITWYIPGVTSINILTEVLCFCQAFSVDYFWCKHTKNSKHCQSAIRDFGVERSELSRRLVVESDSKVASSEITGHQWSRPPIPDDKVDIDAKIKQAKGQLQAMRKNVFTSKEIPLSERLRCYLGKTLSPSIQYFGGARAGRSKFL